MSTDSGLSIRLGDVLYFSAEVAAYVSVGWWGFARDLPIVTRGVLGIGSVVVFAVTWATFASPRARVSLHGAANVVFRLAWFGLGATAGLVVILGRWVRVRATLRGS